MTHPVLRTQRLLLRPLVPEDAEAITPLIGDFEVSKWLTHVPHPYSLEDAHWFITSDGNQPGQNWGIEWDGEFVGSVGCTNELGYWLGRPYWRNGFMTEAALSVVQSWFSDDGHQDLISGHFIGNIASRSILLGLGFVDTNVEEVHALAQDQLVPLQRMTLTRTKWEARHG